MHDVENEEDERFVQFDAITEQKHGNGDKVDQNEYSLSSDNPPIDKRLGGHDQVENA